jgi:hypothetical protein
VKSNYKSSISSRASVRSLIVACLPAAAVAFVANSPALGAAFNEGANHGLILDDNKGASTNGSSTNASGSNTNDDHKVYPCFGIRR